MVDSEGGTKNISPLTEHALKLHNQQMKSDEMHPSDIQVNALNETVESYKFHHDVSFSKKESDKQAKITSSDPQSNSQSMYKEKDNTHSDS